MKVVDFVGDSSSFEAVAARGKWKLGKTLVKLGGGEHFAEARVLLEQAYKVRKKLAPGDKRSGGDLSDEDWNSLVFYLYQ